MSKTFGRIAVVALFPGLLTGCMGDNAAPRDPDLVGTASIALTGVPADGTCVEVTAIGNRTVKRAFDAPAGSMKVVNFGGLPTGKVKFTALAFGGRCADRGTASPNWVSDADFETTIAVFPPALVTLNLVRNGTANISVGFNDDAPTPDGGAGAPDGGASGGSASEGLFFLKVDGVTGEATETGLAGAFNLDDFVLAVTNSTTLIGGGGGAGKSVWAASAKLKFQKGTPELYLLAAQGKHVKSVAVTAKKKKPDGTKQTFYVVTMNDILVTGVQSTGSGDVPNLSVELAFADLQVELLADGGGPSTVVAWDVIGNKGASGPYPFDFVVGGPALAPVKAITTFRAPSEKTSGSIGGSGGGAGKAVFDDASVSLPIDADVLKYLVAAAAGRIGPMGSVEIDTTAPTGVAVMFGKYGFKNVVLHGVTFSGVNAKVDFGAAAFSWTTFGPGGTTTMFDITTNTGA